VSRDDEGPGGETGASTPVNPTARGRCSLEDDTSFSSDDDDAASTKRAPAPEGSAAERLDAPEVADLAAKKERRPETFEFERPRVRPARPMAWLRLAIRASTCARSYLPEIGGARSRPGTHGSSDVRSSLLSSPVFTREIWISVMGAVPCPGQCRGMLKSVRPDLGAPPPIALAPSRAAGAIRSGLPPPDVSDGTRATLPDLVR